MSISFTVSFAAAFFLINGVVAGSSPKVTSKTETRAAIAPAWRVDMRGSIAGDPIGLVSGRGRETQGQPRTSLWFVGNDTIVVTFVVRSDTKKLAHREEPDSVSSLRLVIILVDATTGNPRRTLSLPTSSRFAGIVAVSHENLIVQRGSHLTMLSSALKELKSLELPSLPAGDWHSHSSPSGKTTVLIATNLRTTSAVPWIEVDTTELTISRSWTQVQSGWVSVSDHYLAMSTCVWIYSCEPELQMTERGGSWKKLVALTGQDKPRPKFINDENLFLPGRPRRLISINGQVLFTENVDKNGCWWGDPIPSEAGQRFVFPVCKTKGGISSFDIGGYSELSQIDVYDAPFRGRSHSLDVTGPILKNLTLLALSNDGTLLAALNDLSLELFRLPQ